MGLFRHVKKEFILRNSKMRAACTIKTYLICTCICSIKGGFILTGLFRHVKKDFVLRKFQVQGSTYNKIIVDVHMHLFYKRKIC